MQVEALLKNRIAGGIVSFMLQDAGYLVVNYGYEGIPDFLMQVGFTKKQKTGQLLSEMPHFVVLNKKTGEIHLLRVRFIGSGKSGRSVEREERWPGTHLIAIKPTAPHFFVLIRGDQGTGLRSLVEHDTFKLGKKRVERYGVYIKKFLH